MGHITVDPSSWAAGADAAWTDYDIYTNKSIPKGAVAEIIIGNGNTSNARLIGVRPDGSAVNCYIDMNPANTDGYAQCRMLVQVHVDTGLIECYAEVDAEVVFTVIGYWEDVDYTTIMIDLTVTVDEDGIDAWTLKDLAASGVPASAVCHALCYNKRTDGLREVGVRKAGSAAARKIDTDTCNVEGVKVWDTFVKADASSDIEVNAEYYTHNGVYILGYFSSEMGFEEAWATKAVGSGAWTDTDYTADLAAIGGSDGNIIDMTLLTANATAINIGARLDGAAINRYVPQTRIVTGLSGFGMTVTTNPANGIAELYSGGSETFKFGGFFTITPAVEGWAHEIDDTLAPTEVDDTLAVNITEIDEVPA